jgi:ADP-ribose pyrophosphatase YjhB (NUDIX family)
MMKREYPDTPIVGVGAVIVDGGRILLVQRANEPNKGLWAVPGGVLELGEMVREAVQREALEETGLEVRVGEVAAVVDRVVLDEHGRIRYHYVLIDFIAEPSGGTLRPGDDAAGARWVSRDELETMDVVPAVKEIAQRLLP